jgi:serine/threonine protein kinase
LVNEKPLFEGTSEIDQLFKIFQVVGTPNAQSWPGITQFEYYDQVTFPAWQPVALQLVAPHLCPLGLDLLGRMLAVVPSQRITARQAMRHAYFYL